MSQDKHESPAQPGLEKSRRLLWQVRQGNSPRDKAAVTALFKARRHHQERGKLLSPPMFRKDETGREKGYQGNQGGTDPEDVGQFSPAKQSQKWTMMVATDSWKHKRKRRNKHHGGKFFSIIVLAKDM